MKKKINIQEEEEEKQIIITLNNNNHNRGNTRQKNYISTLYGPAYLVQHNIYTHLPWSSLSIPFECINKGIAK